MLKTIVVALDDSDMSEQIVKALNKLLIEPETKIIFSHVLPSAGADSDLPVDKPHQVPESVYKYIEKQLQSYQERVTVQTEIEIVSGDPAEEIIRLANIHGADLIVIGTRGLKGLKRVIEGSVSSQVVADAPCSVLVVKPEEVESV